jgi:DNA invertase Pin-like site-specific DNA recombinase
MTASDSIKLAIDRLEFRLQEAELEANACRTAIEVLRDEERHARVSTYGQTLDAQLDQLRGAGCAKIYREKATGARPDRRELLKLLKSLGPGDVVTVTRIDRLARSTFDLFAIVKQIVDAGGQFRSLAEPWADTATTPGG